ncbi:MAG: hypothetical protein ABI462_09860 [Ignavibacteria bacterium]
MQTDKVSYLKTKLEDYHRKFYKGSKIWSFVYHLCLFGTTILTLLIAFLLNSEFFHGIFGMSKNDSIALIALTAAILSALIAKGGLNAKWRSFRVNSSKIEMLILRLNEDDQNYSKVQEEFEKIISDHDMAIVKSSMKLMKRITRKKISNLSLPALLLYQNHSLCFTEPFSI